MMEMIQIAQAAGTDPSIAHYMHLIDRYEPLIDTILMCRFIWIVVVLFYSLELDD